MVEKANVNGGTTQDTTWAAPLVQYQDFAGDFVEYLRPMTILGKFGSGNIPNLTRVPFMVRIGGQTSGGSASWVGEGKPKPLTKFDFNSNTLPFAKVAAISVLSEELVRFSSPSADRLVRDGLAGAVIARLDVDFIDPGKAAVANTSPASILNGVTPIAPTGTGDADDIRKDIRSLWAPFIAANNPPTTAVYIMTATTALALSLMVNTLGQPEFPGLTMAGGTLGGIPVIVSEYLDNSAGSAGGLIVLVNARDVWLADDGGVTIDLSREASLQMDDAPTNASDTGTEAQMVSMWQTNSVAYRAEREIYWAKRRSTAAQYLDGVQWGQF
jgi:HK97 family phage major capsid protein